jgi:hypothetical protein
MDDFREKFFGVSDAPFRRSAPVTQAQGALSSFGSRCMQTVPGVLESESRKPLHYPGAVPFPGLMPQAHPYSTASSVRRRTNTRF